MFLFVRMESDYGRSPFVEQTIKIKIMEKLKLIFGFVLLPMAFVVFVADRIVYTIMPQLDHKNFNEWLLSTTNVIFAFVRILLVILFRWIAYWIFGI
tara:strand:+ start:908 stop:1198 length:291 start_codon:yes stop_codon:yes gene_type:complete